MGLFFAGDEREIEGVRPRGFDRYRLALEENWKRFLLVDFLTLVGLAPCGAGALLAIRNGNVYILLAACLLGGLIAGPAVSVMVDCIFRALRFHRDDWWVSCRRALRQNWRGSLLPGIVFCLVVTFTVLMAWLMIYDAAHRPGGGTVALLLAGFFFATMVFLTFWPQLVLFEQSNVLRLRNCLLFCIKYFPRTAGVALLNVAWWAVTVLAMPWTGLLIPFFGVWVIWFVSFHLLYDQLNEAFEIEKRIFEQFPEQARD